MTESVILASTTASCEPQTFDVAIIGGGAAGLSAALVLARARRRVAVIDAGSPRNAPATEMHGFISRDGMSPATLLSLARSEVRGYGVEIIAAEVVGANQGPTLTLSNGESLRARRVVIATGATDVLPNISGIAERWGRDVLHCPYCHGWEVRDARLGVLGTNSASVSYALLVRQWSSDVTFFAHDVALTPDEEQTLKIRGVNIVRGRVESLNVEGDRLAAVCLTDGQRIARDALFIRTVNATHPDRLIAQFGCATDSRGFLSVDKDGRTSARRIWAVGNVVDPRLSVIGSAGAAAMTAMAINADLVAEDVELAREGLTS